MCYYSVLSEYSNDINIDLPTNSAMNATVMNKPMPSSSSSDENNQMDHHDDDHQHQQHNDNNNIL